MSLFYSKNQQFDFLRYLDIKLLKYQSEGSNKEFYY
jgi:hypothetical protein